MSGEVEELIVFGVRTPDFGFDSDFSCPRSSWAAFDENCK